MQIEYSKRLLDEHLDVLYIINKLLEVDKLKMLLLNSDQIKLFTYLPKPRIKNEDIYLQLVNKNSPQLPTENDKKFSEFTYMDKRTNLQKAIDAYSAFNNLKNQQKRNKIDNRLL